MEKFNYPKKEEEILSFWQKNKIFEKSLEQNKKNKNFSFYDGPPFATGSPHYGHILASSIKDTITRFFSQRGYYVKRKVGWDCHGLPVENLVEKELGIGTKKEIEKLGIDKFNQFCRKAVTRHVDDFVEILTRFGRFADYDNAYFTMDKNYSESVWWVFKQLDDLGLIYEDRRVLAYCPRCGTPLSNFEVSEGYKDVVDKSVYILFKLDGKINNDKNDNTYFLVWTTTPWTLSANLALAIGDYKYVKIKYENKYLILAKDRLDILDDKYEIIEEYKSKDLLGLKYEPLYPNGKEFYTGGKIENAYKIYEADFVNTEDGSGIVHIAPSFGEDDMLLGRKNKLGMILSVNDEGKSKTEPGKNEDVKKAGELIIEDLRDRGILFKEQDIKHAYPFCWRCDTALLYFPIKTYYIKVSNLINNLVRNNKQIHWVPGYLKYGRFGNWLLDARDWAVSRNRFWGAPIPVWKCENCDYKETIGSVNDLEQKTKTQISDLHRPYIDEATYKCPKCKGRMKRTPEVFDCWFESGAMPYAQHHYPFENKNEMEKDFPADFIAEGLDQTRGWFYTLNVLATALTLNDIGLGKNKPAFKNVVVNGIILAENGKKLSKKLKNYPDPKNIFNIYGADSLRFFLISSAPLGENYRMSEKLIRQTFQNIILRTFNSFQFLDYYKKLYQIEKIDDYNYLDGNEISALPFLDQWILQKMNLLYSEVITLMEKYELVKAARKIDSFIADLSLWYIRRLKSQINSETDAQKRLPVMAKILKDLVVLAAPFLPYLSEIIYKEIKNENEPLSVHLFPIKDKPKVDNRILEKMSQIREAISKLLDLRMQKSLKVRQPLKSASVPFALDEDQKQLIKDELNVKKVLKGELFLDTKLTKELEEEGVLREVIRNFQDLRKKQGYHFGEEAIFYIDTDKKQQEFFNKFTKEIKKATNLNLIFEKKEKEITRFEILGGSVIVFSS